MKPFDIYRRVDTELSVPDRIGNLGVLAQRIAEEDAKLGSESLLRAHERLFARWEEEHGFQPGAAKILLPAGYVPETERVAA